jgi:hypothetical protein
LLERVSWRSSVHERGSCQFQIITKVFPRFSTDDLCRIQISFTFAPHSENKPAKGFINPEKKKEKASHNNSIK